MGLSILSGIIDLELSRRPADSILDRHGFFRLHPWLFWGSLLSTSALISPSRSQAGSRNARAFIADNYAPFYHAVVLCPGYLAVRESPPRCAVTLRESSPEKEWGWDDQRGNESRRTPRHKALKSRVQSQTVRCTMVSRWRPNSCLISPARRRSFWWSESSTSLGRMPGTESSSRSS